MRQGIYYVIIPEESERKSVSERKWDQKLLPYCVTVFVVQCVVVGGGGRGGRVWVHVRSIVLPEVENRPYVHTRANYFDL